MTSLNEKQMVMSNLAQLKNTTERFKKINVTNDYTIEKRLTIGNKVTEAGNQSLRVRVIIFREYERCA